MDAYETLIDPTDFGTVAGYLRRPDSPIQYLLHVRSRDLLAPLAQELVAASASGPAAALQVARCLQRHQHAGSVLLSARQPVPQLNPQHQVDAASIPRRAACDVIYLPPFYLVHTPGLFEGTLIQKQPTQPQPATMHHPPPNQRFRLTH